MFGSRLVVFSFLLFLSLQNLYAQKPIELKKSINEYIFTFSDFTVFEDKIGELTINEVSSESFQKQFKTNPDLYYNKNLNSVYWIKFKIEKTSRFDEQFFIESSSPHTEDLRLYIDGGNSNGWIEKRSGQSLYFFNREFINKNLIFSLPTDTTCIKTFYLRVKSANYSGFDFGIKRSNYFSNYNTNEYFFLGIYYGILIIMALYNLLMYFSIRERVYIYYVLYVLAGMLSTLTEDCLGYQFVWFKFPHWNRAIGYHIAPLLLLFTFVFYSRQFLQLKTILPQFDRVVIYSLIGYSVYYFIHLTILPDVLYFRGFYLIPFILVYISSIISFFKGYKPARFFIMGYTIIFISIIIIQLRANGTIGGNLLTVYSLNYGLVLEIAVLSFAMADRIKYIKKEKEDALSENNIAQQKIIAQLKINEELKDQVNKELEEKVALRTKELNEKNSELELANEKLKDLTSQANQMSLKLDIDNWNLQKRVKESIKDRMFGKEVAYEEFNKIFPDEVTCLRYLEELKWAEPFKCKKCENIKYINGVKVFTRKCTRCGYPESVTAYTLFHGLRFPITKAFYMTYLVHRKNKITLDELSVLLDLRRNTCWNFKKKVVIAIDHYQKVKRRPIETWEDLIVISE